MLLLKWQIYAWLHRIGASEEHCWNCYQAGARGELDKVTDEDIAELLESQAQTLFNEDLKESVKELSQKEEEKEKDGDPPLKSIKTSYLQCIFSAMGAFLMNWDWPWLEEKCLRNIWKIFLIAEMINELGHAVKFFNN